MPFVSIRLMTLLAGSLLASTIYSQPVEPTRAVHVSGRGEVQAEPDRATVMLGVEARQPKLQDARAEVTRTVDAVLKLTRELKIDPKQVHATRIHMRPEYNWGNTGQDRTLVGYYVSRQIEVELRDLDQLGRLIERAVDLGVNQISDPQLDSSRRQELEREALVRAVADARQNAQVLAKAVGAQVGPARVVNASTEFAPPRPIPLMSAARAMGAEAAAADTYQGGEMMFTASVSVQYDLLLTDGQ